VRVFLDTNVLVSAFASRGICADVLELVLLEHDLIIGQNVLREVRKALRHKVKLPPARASEVVDFVAGEAAVVIEGAQPVDAKADADDALVLGEARSGQAEMFVTGDAAPLKLKTVEGLKVISPRQFWEALRAGPR
jgi:putative PIN family toxin of toxin-antitoxin system